MGSTEKVSTWKSVTLNHRKQKQQAYAWKGAWNTRNLQGISLQHWHHCVPDMAPSATHVLESFRSKAPTRLRDFSTDTPESRTEVRWEEKGLRVGNNHHSNPFKKEKKTTFFLLQKPTCIQGACCPHEEAADSPEMRLNGSTVTWLSSLTVYFWPKMNLLLFFLP